MATLRDKKKLAALIKENSEEHTRSNLAQNSNVPKSQEDSITQVSEKIEGRVTKKLYQEFNRTGNRLLAALARLDDFVMNRLIQGYSETAPETSQNAFSTSQGTNGDNSQSDLNPEAGIFDNLTKQNSGPEDGHNMVTGVNKEVTKCSPSTSSGKRRKIAPPVNLNCAMKIPLQRRKQTKFYWCLSSWQTTTILQISITIL